MFLFNRVLSSGIISSTILFNNGSKFEHLSEPVVINLSALKVRFMIYNLPAILEKSAAHGFWLNGFSSTVFLCQRAIWKNRSAMRPCIYWGSPTIQCMSSRISISDVISDVRYQISTRALISWRVICIGYILFYERRKYLHVHKTLTLSFPSHFVQITWHDISYFAVRVHSLYIFNILKFK